MCRNLLNWLTILLVLPSCTSTPPNISVVCEENSQENYIIKWETAPLMEGQVKVYASIQPNEIREDSPVALANISDGMITILNSDPLRRNYYLLVFNNKYRIKVASRNMHITGIQNFRDLGGYTSSKNGKHIRWGMLYRSAQIDSIAPNTCHELGNMDIKTIIDLRTADERRNFPRLDDKFHTVHIPIASAKLDTILKNVLEEKITPDTIYRLVERINRDIVLKYQKEIKEVFTLLLDEKNYPAVIQCTTGKDRTGIISALILSSLGVNEDVIMEDYYLTNDYFNIPRASKYAYGLPTSAQEAITTIYSARKSYLNAAKDEIEKNYDSTRNYLRKAIGLSDEDIKHLRTILLE